MVTEYLIEVRNRRQPGDHWARWGRTDTEQEAAASARRLRAAMGPRYEVRRRRVESDSPPVTPGGAP